MLVCYYREWNAVWQRFLSVFNLYIEGAMKSLKGTHSTWFQVHFFPTYLLLPSSHSQLNINGFVFERNKIYIWCLQNLLLMRIWNRNHTFSTIIDNTFMHIVLHCRSSDARHFLLGGYKSHSHSMFIEYLHYKHFLHRLKIFLLWNVKDNWLLTRSSSSKTWFEISNWYCQIMLNAWKQRFKLKVILFGRLFMNVLCAILSQYLDLLPFLHSQEFFITIHLLRWSPYK